MVSDQSKQEIREREAKDDLTDSMRILSANILRIVRGSGKPENLWPQLEDCMKTLQRFFEAAGRFPGYFEITYMLDCERVMSARQSSSNESSIQQSSALDRHQALGRLWNETRYRVRSGALQVAASILVEQVMQQRRAEKDIDLAIRNLIEIRSELINQRDPG